MNLFNGLSKPEIKRYAAHHNQMQARCGWVSVSEMMLKLGLNEDFAGHVRLANLSVQARVLGLTSSMPMSVRRRLEAAR